MKKVNYVITAKQPIHTGSDENFGTETKLRREKVLLPEPLKIESNFASEDERRQTIIEIILSVWRNIDWDGIGQSRLMGIYDEFASKLVASTGVRTKEQFLNRICEKWGIRSLTNEKVASLLEKFNDDELLELIRQEYQYLILLLRKRNKEKSPGQQNIFEEKTQDVSGVVFEKHFDTVPFISGNSIRGLMRRIIMKDFCDRIGVKSIEKNIYHQLFTGGNITDSTGFEDIEKRETLIEMCPMIGLFGSAIGNMTIQGEMKVGGARLQCRENGTGEKSYWEYIDTSFGTRHDTSKTQKDLNIVENIEGQVNQMKYEFEVFVPGSKFDSVFALTSDNELLESAFWHGLKLYKDFAYIVGNSARDAGLVNIGIELPDDAGEKYLKHLNDNKEDIYEYFNVS